MGPWWPKAEPLNRSWLWDLKWQSLPVLFGLNLKGQLSCLCSFTCRNALPSWLTQGSPTASPCYFFSISSMLSLLGSWNVTVLRATSLVLIPSFSVCLGHQIPDFSPIPILPPSFGTSLESLWAPSTSLVLPVFSLCQLLSAPSLPAITCLSSYQLYPLSLWLFFVFGTLPLLSHLEKYLFLKNSCS